jgi:MATE family multidrug resistance protein
MIIANISTPLLGFVDTAAIGHLGQTELLAGTALGSLIISLLIWLSGFLRMSITGVTAQALGNRNVNEATKLLVEGIQFALILGLFIIVFRSWFFTLLQYFVSHDGMGSSLAAAEQYFSIRVWSVPFVLISLVLSGYLIASGRTKSVLKYVVLSNLVNLVGDILFVVVFDFAVQGLAVASVIADIFLCVSYFLVVNQVTHFTNNSYWRRLHISSKLLSLSGHIFLRSAILQLCLAFMTIYASNYGPTAVAMNAILMQFFIFISFSLDGVAYAAESKVGYLIGKKQNRKLNLVILSAITTSGVWACFYTILYAVLGKEIFALLTASEELIVLSNSYYIWMIALPLVSFLSFIFDGIFIGLAWGKLMLKSMALAGVAFFGSFVMLNNLMENHSLWFAFSMFMIMRGLSQLWMYKRSNLCA